VNSELVVGAIGLAGTLAGAGATFIGVVYQQRQQERSTRAHRHQEQATEAVNKILAELYEIQRKARQAADGLAEADREERYRAQHDSVAQITLTVQAVPDEVLRVRIQENVFFVLLNPPEDSRTERERRMDTMWLCADSVECLGAYLREEPLPEQNDRVVELYERFPSFRDSRWFIEE
jgi:membrane-bound lytic murein transglycosylase